MNTVKLYDTDSHLKEFDATVVDCRKADNNYEIILDKTAFFPEGGGQSFDVGFIDTLPVSNVQINDGVIIHYTHSPIEINSTVHCKIDFDTRFRRMQNHSGEHIVSGIVHKTFGYDNVGFHLGDVVTVDFNGELNKKDLKKVEYLSNEAVFKNVVFTAEYPEAETLKNMEYRSKLDLKENVRIVTIDGYDKCACCAPHVSLSGEIGIIKILDSMRHRGGTRITLLCGFDAYEDYCKKIENISIIAERLCAKQNESAEIFDKFYNDHLALKAKVSQLSRELTQIKSSSFSPVDGNIILFEEDTDMNAIRKLAVEGAKYASGLCLCCFGDDNNGYSFVCSSNSIKLREKSKDINIALNGKGGGSDDMLQGFFKATKAEITKFFNEVL